MAGEEVPGTPVSVPVATSAATSLSESTSTPSAVARGAGVVVTYAGTDTRHLIVFRTKSRVQTVSASPPADWDLGLS
ncbi:hypothetical protein [Streptomyces rishiriensis]|uniref:2,3-bisphosphoglycerate-independent phosphoglycerate mutase n=1 Tax=Streptomyces rishiriensis TaxID=68264 RepID=A0ABU0NI63_STRRH|nr:hypothetical protein [Streptomyces rishiriensis]MDQ0578779.1 2,3-bisphosphoglycerate-independent phosphoglycerate mutase [Streptomyces rishiriensis]